MTTSAVKITQDQPGAGSEKSVFLKNVGKKYEIAREYAHEARSMNDLWALKEISLELARGEVLGVIGRNGAGKTTLLNIASGILIPTEGDVSVKSRILGLFNLGTGFQDELTGKENIFLNAALLGAGKKEIQGKLSSIADFSELGDFLNAPLGTYSQGMRLRLGFGIIANLDFDVLVIDEVLAVGDTLFQNKCLEKLMDFKRSGKTLIITTQNMDLIERLSDKVMLLEHGKMLFLGDPAMAIAKYRALLNNEKFFVGPTNEDKEWVFQTKKWAEERTNWGNELGTKEVIIGRVKFLNKFGLRVRRLKTGEALRIKAYLKIRNHIKEPHFGVAIFREDGVYCYGPNTAFDGFNISRLKQGKSWFTLEFKKMLLAPGKYRVSIAVWDKNEALAFNYHEGCYPLIISGSNPDNSLISLPVVFKGKSILNAVIPGALQNKINNDLIEVDSVKLLGLREEEKTTIFTNEPIRLRVNFRNLEINTKNYFLWLGLYRDDDVYCQGFPVPLTQALTFDLDFPAVPLLPGGYKFALGIWDNDNHSFIMYDQRVNKFNVAFNRRDHGTVYLEHKWDWRFK